MAELTLRKKIEKVLKKSKGMYPSDISEKIGYPYLEVLKELELLKKEGLVKEGKE